VKKFKDILAEVVSRVLDPVWEIPVAIVLAVTFAMQEGLRWRFVGLLLFIDGVVPMIFFLTMLLNKQSKIGIFKTELRGSRCIYLLWCAIWVGSGSHMS